jgi:hypothetical protein
MPVPSLPVLSRPARRLRRLTGGAALVLFPALIVLDALIDPSGGGTGAGTWQAVTQHPGAVAVSAVALLLSGVLMVPAAAAILHQARDRGAPLANVAAVVAVLGGFGNAFIATFSLVSLSLAGGDRAEMTAFADRVNADAWVRAVGLPLVLCFGLGAALLVWAAWRAGQVGWWAPAVVTAVAVLIDVVLDDPPLAVDVVLQAIPAVIFAYLGVRVLRMSDAAWDGVPGAARVTVGAAA